MHKTSKLPYKATPGHTPKGKKPGDMITPEKMSTMHNGMQPKKRK